MMATNSFHSAFAQHSVDDDATARFVPHWRIRNDVWISSYYASYEIISHLAIPVEDHVLANLNNFEVLRMSYQSLGQSTLGQAKLLKRFEQLHHDHHELVNQHEGCQELSDRLIKVKNDYERKLREMKKEKDEWRKTSADQVEKIKKLEKDLEMAHHNVVKEIISTVVSGLHDSAKYKKSLVVLFSLSFTARCPYRQKDEKLGEILKQTDNLDIEGSKAWKSKYKELSTIEYPYVQKIVDSHMLPLDEPMKIVPDVLNVEKTGPSALATSTKALGPEHGFGRNHTSEFPPEYPGAWRANNTLAS
ncbi:hypothetical protein Tco_1465169 [Tanacetum coccineum]